MNTTLQTTLAQHDRGLPVNSWLKDQAISALVNKTCGLHASEDESGPLDLDAHRDAQLRDEAQAAAHELNSAGREMAIHI